MFTDAQTALLKAPLAESRVKKRAGAGGRTFDHIEGWDAIRHANEVFGFAGWSRELVELREVWAGIKERPKMERGQRVGVIEVAAVAYTARVRVTVYAGSREIVREGVGFGNGDGPNLGDAHELACKEAETDAMKRALATFGFGFGLALYDKAKEHVASDDEVNAEIERGAGRAASAETRAQEPAREAESKPAFKREEPKRETAARAAKPAPAAPAKREEPKRAESEEREEPKRTAPGAKRFPAPQTQTVAAWETWSKQLAAYFRTRPRHSDALALIEDHSEELRQCATFAEIDMKEWAIGLADKYCANQGAQAGRGK